MKKVVDEIIRDLYKQYVGKYDVMIGVFKEKSKDRKDYVDGGPTNADLLYWHEKGIPERSVPERPILKFAIERSDKVTERCVQQIMNGLLYKNWTSKDVFREINIYGSRVANIAIEIFKHPDGTLVDNAESTIRRKGMNHPLVDSGDLENAISYKVIKK